MGKKYVIELEDEPIIANRVKYWQATKFPTIFFSAEELNELEDYKEPVGHKLEVGDVCYMTHASLEGKVLITCIDSTTISYIWADGHVGSAFRGAFEKCAKFIYHSDALGDFFGGK